MTKQSFKESKNINNNNNQNIIHIPDFLIKDNTPFIPKNYYNKPRKDSSNYSTSESDSMSPERRVPSQQKKKPFKGEAKDFKIKYKTELCKYYSINGTCKYGDKCAYAHGVENLRSKVTNTTAYRTKKCTQFFEHGYCPYGNRCQFAHQLKTNILNNPYDKTMSYCKILETISKLENVGNIKKLIEKPRLPVFENIYKEKNKKKEKTHRLLDDIKKLRNEGLY